MFATDLPLINVCALQSVPNVHLLIDLADRVIFHELNHLVPELFFSDTLNA